MYTQGYSEISSLYIGYFCSLIILLDLRTIALSSHKRSLILFTGHEILLLFSLQRFDVNLVKACLDSLKLHRYLDRYVF